MEAIYVDEKPQTLEQLPKLIEQVLFYSTSRFSQTPGMLTIEFFLPLELLYFNIDQLMINVGLNLPVAIGTQYSVVVRSLERLNDRRSWPSWINKWNRLLALSQSKENNAFLYLHNIEEFNLQNSSGRLREQNMMCLVLTFVPSVEDQRKIFSAVLSAGIPVVLYTRQQDMASNEIEMSLKALLTDNSLSDIPATVTKLRREAATSGDKRHLGLHLGLLWDDPNRLPLQAKIASPEESLVADKLPSDTLASEEAPIPVNIDDLVTVKEAARQLRVVDTTVRRWMKKGYLEFVVSSHTGRQRNYIRRSTLQAVLAT
jgi:excisionase family DNA binding protein